MNEPTSRKKVFAEINAPTLNLANQPFEVLWILIHVLNVIKVATDITTAVRIGHGNVKLFSNDC